MKIFLKKMAVLDDKFISLNDKGTILGVFLRQDAEKSPEAHKISLLNSIDASVQLSGSAFEPAVAALAVRAFNAAFDQVDVIVTDRLHAAVNALQMNKQVLALDNSYGKVFGILKNFREELQNLHQATAFSLQDQVDIVAQKKDINTKSDEIQKLLNLSLAQMFVEFVKLHGPKDGIELSSVLRTK